MLRPSLYSAALKAFRVRNGTFLPFVSLQQASLETPAALPGCVSGFSFAPALCQISFFFFRPPCSPRQKVPRGTPVLSRAVLDHFWQISRFLGPFSPQDNIFAQKCLNPTRTHSHELARTCTNLHELFL